MHPPSPRYPPLRDPFIYHSTFSRLLQTLPPFLKRTLTLTAQKEGGEFPRRPIGLWHYSISSRLLSGTISDCFGNRSERTPFSYFALMPPASMPVRSKVRLYAP